MVEKELTNYQIEILKSIVYGSIKAISYHKPQTQLRGVVKNKNLEETLAALRSLESDFGILALNPTLRFGVFGKCGYKVNLDQAQKLYNNLDQTKKLYNSHVREKER